MDEPDPDSTRRYSRQIRIPGIGEAGQQAIGASTVLVVGLGALGTHAADTLARAGTGNLWLCDRDIVDWTNLQRQVLFTEADAAAGTPKAIAAAQALRAANSAISIEAHVEHCSAEFLDALPRVPDLVLDGTDNFPTRYLLNDWCSQHDVPWIYAGAVGNEGVAALFPAGGPCLRCLWPTPPSGSDVASCETAGILAPAIASVTAFQTAEALKLLAGRSDDNTKGLFTCDVWRGQYGVTKLMANPDPDCPVCQGREFPALQAGQSEAVTLCGRDAVQIDPPGRRAIDLEALAAKLQGAVEELERTRHLLRFTADNARFSVFPGGRTLVFGIPDPLRARALFDRWVGID